MVELARVEPGSRVLDVAADYGEPSLTAAAVAGPEGKVVATDISPEMLLYGRKRAAAAGLENVKFVESEAASLDFPAKSFDAALSRFGIIFEPEAEATAGRVRGFLVPGSRMVISSWGPPERVPFITFRWARRCALSASIRPRPERPGRCHARRRRPLADCSRGWLLRRRGRGDRGQLRVGVRRRVRRHGQGHGSAPRRHDR
jgi:SAM-dependent methyltransferase